MVIQPPEVKDDRVRVLINTEKINEIGCSEDVLVTVYKNRYGHSEPLGIKYGDVIEITGRLEALPHRRNPGEFNYGEYLRIHNISAVFTAFGYDKINVTGFREQNFYYSKIVLPVREYSIQVIDSLIGGDEGEYLKGLVLGERSNISKQMKENFINAGVAHIIAVSGLNVAYVIIIIWGVLLFVPIKQSYKTLITILFLLFYMNLTGNTPSIVRAVIMASVFLTAWVIERKPNVYNIVSAAALVILLIDPRQLFDAGFILSFTAVISIIIIYPKLNEAVKQIGWYRNLDPEKLTAKAIKGTMALFLGTVAAQMGTLPITAIMFKKVSVISLLANLFAIPLSNIALAAGFVMIIFSAVSTWLASVFAALNSFLLYVQIILIEFCAGLDHAYVETYFIDRFMFVCYYIALVLALSITKRNLYARVVMILMIALNFFIWRSVIDKTDKAEITYLDAGSSSSTLIKMPLGTSVLVNAGTSTANNTASERNIIPYLKSSGLSALDVLIITSLNTGEFKSACFLINNFPVKKVYIPEFYKPVFESSGLFSKPAGTTVEFIDISKIINRQGNFRVYLYYDSLASGRSLLAQFVYGGQSFLFNDSYTADEDFYNTVQLPVFDGISNHILKTSGAGSFDYTSAEFLTKSDPQFVVISQSRSTRKKLNSDAFTQTLEYFGVNVLTTRNGALIFETDGNTTEIVKW
jgi:competence protein ComEC